MFIIKYYICMCAKFRSHNYVIVYSRFEEQVLSVTAAHAVWPHGRGGLRTQDGRTVGEAYHSQGAGISGTAAHAVWPRGWGVCHSQGELGLRGHCVGNHNVHGVQLAII